MPNDPFRLVKICKKHSIHLLFPGVVLNILLSTNWKQSIGVLVSTPHDILVYKGIIDCTNTNRAM